MMFGSSRLVDACHTQTSPAFEGRCECQRISRMEHHSPTPPLSKPGSSLLAASDQELSSPSNISPLSIGTRRTTIKQESPFKYALNHHDLFNDMTSYSYRSEEYPGQYVAIRDVQQSSYEQSSPQFFQYPTFQPAPLSYLNYQDASLDPQNTAPISLPDNYTMDQFSLHSFDLPIHQELGRRFDGTTEEPYITPSAGEEEEDSLSEKPYARLIYEALKQAPGHRMMLREIYDWFQRHTTKPTESGTNGWQNSIRHNLSMNQAFENDKSDLASSGGQKQKVNSVWVLTENAIKHGVNPTTRYRKTGSGKRMNSNRIPAPLRQRSGAKGGKAARRAAQLRKKEHLLQQRQQPPSYLQPPQWSTWDHDDGYCDGAESSDTFSAMDPATPLLDLSFPSEPSYGTPQHSIEASLSPVCTLASRGLGDNSAHSLQELGYDGPSDLTPEEILRVHQNSISSNTST